jgi:hypothetical protein
MMKKTKLKNPKYPLRIKLEDGTKIVLPRQSKFDDPFLRKHGCSLMAEYEALQWLGVKKYPIHLLKWHRENTPGNIFAKVTVKGVMKGINALAKGKGSAKYYTVTESVDSFVLTRNRIKKALKDGKVVIFEQKDPIHTVLLLQEDNTIYILNHGTCRKITLDKQMEKLLTNTKYKGIVIVSRKEESK